MSNQKAVKRSILMPLIGLTLGWVSFIAAIWANLYVPYPQWDENGNQLTTPQVEPGTYLFLLGILLFSVFALIGQRQALAIRGEQDSAFAKSSHRLNNLAVIVALVAGAVFAIGNFLGAFNTYDSRDASPLVRIFGVYVPIVLATILVVALILFAFVFRQDAPDVANIEQDEERERLRRYAGLAYASPIIGTAIAVILGLVVFDVTRTNLNVWIWVVIQAIIATSIIIGTNFASKVRSAKPLPPKPRQSGVAAINLNLVLTIIFGVAVTIMSFTYGASAVDELRQWNAYAPESGEVMFPDISVPDLEWFVSKFFPAVVLLALAEFGVYRSIVTRHAVKEEIA